MPVAGENGKNDDINKLFIFHVTNNNINLFYAKSLNFLIPIPQTKKIMALPFSTPMGVNFSNTFQSNPVSNATAAANIIATGIKPVKMFNYEQTKFFDDAKGLQLIPGVPNSDLAKLASNDATTLKKIVTALTPYSSKIAAIMVGNEPLLENASVYGPLLGPALTNLNAALIKAGIKTLLSVPFNSGIESVSWPPSSGTFSPSYNTYLTAVCSFLQSTNSFFTINIYPYYAHMGNKADVPLDYCLFTKKNPQFNDPNNNLPYYNIFDAMYDATVSALNNLGYGSLPLVVGETGWPTAGNPTGSTAASVANATTFNQNLVNHVKSGNGTPANPNAVLQTFLFEMYDENLKTGNAIEKHWGVYKNTTGNTYAAKYNLTW